MNKIQKSSRKRMQTRMKRRSSIKGATVVIPTRSQETKRKKFLNRMISKLGGKPNDPGLELY